MAIELARRGWVVYAVSRSGVAPVAPELTLPPRAAVLDVTDPGSTDVLVARIVAETGRLDLVINNAGINVSGVFEEVTAEQGDTVMQVNFYGMVNVTRAALAVMRAQGHGTLVTIGSLAGLVAPPGESWYAASKHALEGFLESLHHEVRHLGVRVLLAEPGFIRTGLAAAAPSVPGTLPEYAAQRAALLTHWHKSISGGMPADRMASAIVNWVERPAAGLRRRFGTDAQLVAIAKRLLPEPLFFAITRRIFGI
jgi:NAD(P)-dependent dehydrogenase (short-subunit alcohol dehydrogenase family)